MSESFRKNGLVPSAALLVLPSSGGSQGPSSIIPSNFNAIFSFFTLLFAPLLQLWTTVFSYLTGRGGGGDTASTPDGSNNRSADGRPPRRFRRDGNIARLGSGADDDDENNTWNGNSTQQM